MKAETLSSMIFTEVEVYSCLWSITGHLEKGDRHESVRQRTMDK